MGITCTFPSSVLRAQGGWAVLRTQFLILGIFIVLFLFDYTLKLYTGGCNRLTFSFDCAHPWDFLRSHFVPGHSRNRYYNLMWKCHQSASLFGETAGKQTLALYENFHSQYSWFFLMTIKKLVVESERKFTRASFLLEIDAKHLVVRKYSWEQHHSHLKLRYWKIFTPNPDFKVKGLMTTLYCMQVLLSSESGV